MRHLRNLEDVSPEECRSLVEWGLRLKTERAAGQETRRLEGKVLGLLFEKSSMRTRVSFEAAMTHQGGSSIFLSSGEVGLGKRETVADVARVVSTYVDVLAVRTFSDSIIAEIAENASCPVINALSDGSHPCQALGDLCTIQEVFGRLEGLKLTFVGDGNNVARSLALSAVHTGMQFVLCTPAGHEFRPEFLDWCRRLAGANAVQLEPDVKTAVAGADIVYADVWTSMGQEAERHERQKVFARYQVDGPVMASAKPAAKFMHCLPAHRGEEVTGDVIDGPASIVVQQAGNRLHAQKALLLWLLGKIDVTSG